MVLFQRLTDDLLNDDRFKEVLEAMENSPSNEFVYPLWSTSFTARLKEGERSFRITIEMIEGEDVLS